VAKVSSLGHAPTYDYLRQQKFFQSVIQPVLGDYTVRQELVILYNSDIINHLNKFLRSVEHLRKDKFKGTWVGQSDWGLLVEDMRPQGEFISRKSHYPNLRLILAPARTQQLFVFRVQAQVAPSISQCT
jgi:hypothetical protein